MNTGPARGGSVAAPIVGTPIVQAAPTPADKPAPAATQPPANRFAELLQRNRAEAPKPAAPLPGHAPRTNSAAGGAEVGDTATIEANAAPANAAKARAATTKETSDKSVVRESDCTGAKSEAASGDEGADKDHGSDRSERPAAPMSAADRLDSRPVADVAVDALRRLGSANSAAIDDAGGTSGTDREASSAAGAATRYSLGHARGTASVDAANDRAPSRVDASRDGALCVAADASFQVATAEALPSSDSAGATAAHTRALDALTASLGVGAPSPGADPGAALDPSSALALPTPIDAPDFAAALGVRVSMLVEDGVQRAELHLNPAETGPVSIHITLDGTAARVDFGADVAATRAAIERGLPELASALRDAGFTLAGGGVSQHAGSRASSDDPGQPNRRADGIATPVSTSIATGSRAVVRTVAAGGVDLYA